jgi:two-component system, chemotaxis family, chemotaxis protein CheY
MKHTDFSEHRVLLLGAKTHALVLLRSLLGHAGITKIIQVEDPRRALELLSMEHFSAVFCEPSVGRAKEKPFIVAARRSDAMLNPMIPIFVMQECARRRDVEKARDTGVTDVLTTPISPKTLIDKLRAATQTPRPFIVAPEFFGPDRRAKARPVYFGSDRRKRAPKKTKIDFTHI